MSCKCFADHQSTDLSLVKYVALLAFQEIVHAHPYIVSMHQDVILSCLDDADISIRFRALDLIVSMVDSSNLVAIVGKLMRQLRSSPVAVNTSGAADDRSPRDGILPTADFDEENPEESLRPAEQNSPQPFALPEDYRVAVSERILEMCSRCTYANISDFSWYIDTLVQLVFLAPVSTGASLEEDSVMGDGSDSVRDTDVTRSIGLELQNVAVRVRDVRPEVTKAAESLIAGRRNPSSVTSGVNSKGYLGSVSWLIGEYAGYLNDPDGTLSNLLHFTTAILPADILTIHLQAIPKVFLATLERRPGEWNSEQKTMTSLLVARIVQSLDTLTSHPNLEVQERAVELAELMKLVADAVSAQSDSTDQAGGKQMPLIMSQVVPSLFKGLELNPVAPAAQKKVPLPDGLDLDQPINDSLSSLLQSAAVILADDRDTDESTAFYYRRPARVPSVAEVEPAVKLLDQANAGVSSYQQQHPHEDAEAALKRRSERRERNKDDPFYIPTEDDSGTSTPMHDIIKQSNGMEMDIDSIPIMDLSIDARESSPPRDSGRESRPLRRRVDIISDETISFDGEEEEGGEGEASNAMRRVVDESRPGRSSKTKKSLLQVDSSGLGGVSLEEGSENISQHPADRLWLEEEDKEMMRALREVENRRLELQRATERVMIAHGVPEEGTLIKKKVKKKKKKKTKKRNKEVAVDVVEEEGSARDVNTEETGDLESSVEASQTQGLLRYQVEFEMEK